jgi:hypothetical protein
MQNIGCNIIIKFNNEGKVMKIYDEFINSKLKNRKE